MRLAVIADIHGNQAALEAVLSDIDAAQVDDIVCLGDVIALGPQPKQALDRVRALRCSVVMGNCDAWFASWPLPEESGNTFDMISWAAGQLSPDDFAYIRSFKPHVEVEIDGGTEVLCFHGSPRSYDDVILSTTAASDLDEMLGDRDAAVMIGGHTHVPMVRRRGQSLIVNAGSVGLARTPAGVGSRNFPWAEYALIDCQFGHLHVDLRRVPLDVPVMLREARSSALPHLDAWMRGWEG